LELSLRSWYDVNSYSFHLHDESQPQSSSFLSVLADMKALKASGTPLSASEKPSDEEKHPPPKEPQTTEPTLDIP
jgi:hypothetical protein